MTVASARTSPSWPSAPTPTEIPGDRSRSSWIRVTCGIASPQGLKALLERGIGRAANA